MKGLKVTTIAHKKIEAQMTKKRKADNVNGKKEKAIKKNSGAPKRPPTAFFLFMEEFRKSYKENFPDNKSVAVVAKACGEKWKSLSESEKAPYVEKAVKKKAEYVIAMEEYKKLNDNGQKPEESEKSSSEVHDEVEQEASS